LFDLLVAYLIDSSAAIDNIAKRLAVDPRHADQVIHLKQHIDSAKFLMTQVFHPCVNPPFLYKISSPLFSSGKSGSQVYAGTSEEVMSVRPSVHQRSSGDSTTFGDIPPEVVRKAFVHLSPSDLAAIRLVCRGWNPTAQDVMTSRLRVVAERKEKILCGLLLRRLVGFDNFTIKTLELTVRGNELACIHDIINYADLTLSSLKLDFKSPSSICYYALRVISNYCSGIRHLQFTGFEFGPSVAVLDEDILKVVEIGLSRLNRLDLIRCRGNISSFIEHVGFPNLRWFGFVASGTFTSRASEEFIIAIAMKYPTLAGIQVKARFKSSSSLLKVVESCRDLEKLIYQKKSGDLVLSRSDVLSLRRLKHLEIGCEVNVDAVSALAKCKNLKSLRVGDSDLSEVLPAIGMNLVSLKMGQVSKEVFEGIAQYCVNLQHLETSGDVADGESVEVIKKGLKKLMKLKVNGASTRLGADWEGN
jgi:hypothetical protein